MQIFFPKENEFESRVSVLPETVNKLVELGRIHKIESKNSFIVCSNSNCASNTIFTICERCDKVKELKNNNLTAGMSELIKKNGQSIKRYNLEFFVLCKSCKSN